MLWLSVILIFRNAQKNTLLLPGTLSRQGLRTGELAGGAKNMLERC
jgi:hypothetical protein